MCTKIILIVVCTLFSGFSQVRQFISEKSLFNNQIDTTTQIIKLDEYDSHDYEFMFNHLYSAENDIHLTTVEGHRLLFTDINNNSVVDMVGNSATFDSSKVGYAEYNSNTIPIFNFVGNFTSENYWPEKIVDINNDNLPEIFLGSYYPNMNCFSNNGSLLKNFPVRSQWGDQKTLIADIDANTKIDFVIDQYLDNEYSINFFEYDYKDDSLDLITKIDSIMIRYVVNGDTIDTLVHVFGGFSDYVYGDLDNDGYTEVATGHTLGYINIFEKNYDGYSQIYYDNLNTFNMYYIALTNDLDMNGKKELIVMGNYDGGSLFWIEADSNNTYSVKRKAFIEYGQNASILTMNMYSTDVDLDDKEDLVFTGRSKIWVLKWNVYDEKWDMFFYLDENHDYDDMWGNGHNRSFPGLSVNTEFYDIDKDGDNDMFISTDENITLFFRSNLSTLGIDPYPENFPQKISLLQNYPNPFNPITTITYFLPRESEITLKIFDMLGRELATLVNEKKLAGTYNVEFNAVGLSSGIYFYKLRSGNFIEIKKMILLK